MRSFFVLLTIALVTALPPVAHAQFGNMLQKSGVKITEADTATMKESVARVLEKQQVNSVDPWKSPSGLEGSSKLLRTFETDGKPCGEVAILVRGPARTVPIQLNYCKATTGKWLIAP